MDSLWFKIEILIHHVKAFLDLIFGPLNALGPAPAIFIIALLTVLLTKLLSAKFNTRRYKMLTEQFQYWYNVRQEASKFEDHEKAKRLARNIDQAELNRVYYDYFFEGLMKSLFTKYLPIFLMLAYVNDAYASGNLMKHFGREYIFQIPRSAGDPVRVGAVFWFAVSLFIIYMVWPLIRWMVSGRRGSPQAQE